MWEKHNYDVKLTIRPCLVLEGKKFRDTVALFVCLW